MTWHTHALFGISALWLLSPVSAEVLGYDFGTLAAVAALGAFLPDLDASEPKLKHLKVPNTRFEPFLLPAQTVHRTDHHRGLLHSAAGLGMMAACSLPLAFFAGWAIPVTLLIGYLSHLVADSATKSGVRWLYPQQTTFHVLPRPLLRVRASAKT